MVWLVGVFVGAVEKIFRLKSKGNMAHCPDGKGVRSKSMSDLFIQKHLQESREIIGQLSEQSLIEVVQRLVRIRARGGRIFFLGVGGSAANCAHAVNDFRKLAGMEAYAPTDNVAELTARINDEGWVGVFASWLKASRLLPRDGVFVLSVGGGDRERNVSPNLVEALDYALAVGASIVGIVGRDGGYTAQKADACVLIPVVNPESVTPHTEAFQALILHLIVSHPALKMASTQWEAVTRAP